ncbi:MAG: hypothetical protein ACRDNS_24490 [Trebonia sp.]
MVHRWPPAGTHWRSSAQIAQTSTAAACSTPQVAQIQNAASPAPVSGRAIPSRLPARHRVTGGDRPSRTPMAAGI